jgi:bifunctional UDP-N-acetylglucosamine pyrophosphorylase/glucosamine-1-phosphate N-acetyltransferase
MKNVTAIVLAAGQGTRMKSQRAKVLHELCGRPLLQHVLDAAFAAGVKDAVVVVGFDAENVRASLARYGDRVRTAVQPEQRGTGHAVECALPEVPAGAEELLILCGDTPLLEAADLERLMRALADAGPQTQLCLLTCEVSDPAGYGRIIRDGSGAVVAIREHRDCSPEERAIGEINPGVYVARAAFLRERGPAAEAEQRAARALPHRRRRAGRGDEAGGVASVLVEDAESVSGHQRSRAARRGRGRRCTRASPRAAPSGVTVRDRAPASTRASWSSPRPRSSPASCCAAPPWSARRAHRRGLGAHRRGIVEPARTSSRIHRGEKSSTIGVRAQIGPFSHLRPESDDRGGGPRRQLRRDQEDDDGRARRPTTSRTSATARSARARTSAPARSSATTTASRSTAPTSARARSSAATRSSWRPVTIGAGAYVATGTTVTRTCRPTRSRPSRRVKQENKEGYAIARCHQLHRAHTEVLEHRGGGVVFARVVRELQQPVRVDGVVADRLQLVRADLVGQADTSPLLSEVEDDALADTGDLLLGVLELLLAVALEGPEHLAGEALGVDPAQDVAPPFGLPLHEGYVIGRQPGLRVVLTEVEHDHAEVTETRRNPRFRADPEQRPDCRGGNVHLSLSFLACLAREF